MAMASATTNPTDVSSKDELMSGPSSGPVPNSPTSADSTPNTKVVQNIKLALQPSQQAEKPSDSLPEADSSVSPIAKSPEDAMEEDPSSPDKNGQASDNTNSKSASQSNSKSQSSKKYYCPTCSQGFTRKHNMISHELIHSQMKPHVCPVCNLTFRRIHDLKRHEKLHSGEKPFQCYQCGKRFARPDSLTRHQHSPNACSGMFKTHPEGSAGERGDSSSPSVQRPHRPALPPLGLIRSGSNEYFGGNHAQENGQHWPDANPQSYVYSHNAGPGYFTTTTTTTTTTRHINSNSSDNGNESRNEHGHHEEHHRAVERFKQESDPTEFSQQGYSDQKAPPDTRIPQDMRLQQDPQLQHDPRFIDGRGRQDLRTPTSTQFQVKVDDQQQESRKRTMPFGDRNDSPYSVPFSSASSLAGGRLSGQSPANEHGSAKLGPATGRSSTQTHPPVYTSAAGKPQAAPRHAPQQQPQQPRPQYPHQPQYGGYVNPPPPPTLYSNPPHQYMTPPFLNQVPPDRRALSSSSNAELPPHFRRVPSQRLQPTLPPQQQAPRDLFQGDPRVLYNQPRNTSMYQYPSQQEYISLSRYQDLVAYTESLEGSLSKISSRIQLLEDESADYKIEKERQRQVDDERSRRKRHKRSEKQHQHPHHTQDDAPHDAQLANEVERTN